MITPLERPLRRLIDVGGEPYVVTLSNEGIHLARKGHRKGVDASWSDVLAGGLTVRAQLQASLAEPVSRRGRAREDEEKRGAS